MKRVSFWMVRGAHLSRLLRKGGGALGPLSLALGLILGAASSANSANVKSGGPDRGAQQTKTEDIKSVCSGAYSCEPQTIRDSCILNSNTTDIQLVNLKRPSQDCLRPFLCTARSYAKPNDNPAQPLSSIDSQTLLEKLSAENRGVKPPPLAINLEQFQKLCKTQKAIWVGGTVERENSVEPASSLVKDNSLKQVNSGGAGSTNLPQPRQDEGQQLNPEAQDAQFHYSPGLSGISGEAASKGVKGQNFPSTQGIAKQPSERDLTNQPSPTDEFFKYFLIISLSAALAATLLYNGLRNYFMKLTKLPPQELRDDDLTARASGPPYTESNLRDTVDYELRYLYKYILKHGLCPLDANASNKEFENQVRDVFGEIQREITSIKDEYRRLEREILEKDELISRREKEILNLTLFSPKRSAQKSLGLGSDSDTVGVASSTASSSDTNYEKRLEGFPKFMLEHYPLEEGTSYYSFVEKASADHIELGHNLRVALMAYKTVTKGELVELVDAVCKVGMHLYALLSAMNIDPPSEKRHADCWIRAINEEANYRFTLWSPYPGEPFDRGKMTGPAAPIAQIKRVKCWGVKGGSNGGVMRQAVVE